MEYSEYLDKKVYHPEYGEGIVTEVEDNCYKGDYPICVDFNDWDEQWLSIEQLDDLIIYDESYYSLTF